MLWLPEIRTVPAPPCPPRSVLCWWPLLPAVRGRVRAAAVPPEWFLHRPFSMSETGLFLVSPACRPQAGGGPDPPACCSSWPCPHASQPQPVAPGLELGADLLSSAPAGFQFRTILSFHVFSVASYESALFRPVFLLFS